MSFTDVTAVTPFNFQDLDGATCELRSAGIGAGVVGYQLCYVSVWGRVWYRESNGNGMQKTKDFVTGVNCTGKDLQLGFGASAPGGPLLRVS